MLNQALTEYYRELKTAQSALQISEVDTERIDTISQDVLCYRKMQSLTNGLNNAGHAIIEESFIIRRRKLSINAG